MINETFLNLLERIEDDTISLCDSALTIKPGHALYIKGCSSSGKTEFVYSIIASLLIPDKENEHKDDSLYTFILFDNDLRFNLKRLLEIALHRLEHIHSSSSLIENVDAFIKDVLSKIWILQCFDSTSFKVSVSSLKRRMECIEESIQSDSQQPIKMKWIVMVDSIDAYYWTERQDVTINNRNNQEHYRKSDSLFMKIMEENLPHVFVFCTCSLQYISRNINEKENTILLSKGKWKYKHHEKEFQIEEDGFKFIKQE